MQLDKPYVTTLRAELKARVLWTLVWWVGLGIAGFLHHSYSAGAEYDTCKAKVARAYASGQISKIAASKLRCDLWALRTGKVICEG